MNFRLTFLLLFSSYFSMATTYYVATTGSNSNSGTLASPFKTVGKAASVTQLNDFILVRGGTYRHASFGNTDIWDNGNAENITCNGAPGAYITIMPYNNETVTFEFDNNYGVFISNSSYLIFKGFKVKGIASNITQTQAQAAWGYYKLSGDNTVYTLPFNETQANAILPLPAGSQKPTYYNGRGLVVNSSHHVDLLDNEIYDCPSSGIRVEQSDWVNVIGNDVHNNTYWTTQGVGAITSAEATNVDNVHDYKIIIERNKVYDNENRLVSWNPSKNDVKMVIDEGSGIFLTRNRDTYLSGKFRIANNVVYNSGAGGITVHFTNHTLVANNTVFENGTTNDGFPGGIGVNNTEGVILANNLIQSRTTKWAIGTVAQPNTNLIVTNNIVFNQNSITQAVNNNIATGWTNANPQFVNSSSYNFTLQSSSPAINNANSSYAPSTDYSNNNRVGSPDIGAFEYQSPIPVELMNFSLIKKENTVELTWQTASENGNKQFDIERSSDAKTWEKIGIVEGHGFSNTLKNYAFTDETPQNSTNYYRLRQVDFDGSFEFSNVLTAHFSSKSTPSVFPNPFSEKLTVSGLNGDERILIFDALGRQVSSIKVWQSSVELNLDNLPSQAAYFVKIGNLVSKVFKN